MKVHTTNYINTFIAVAADCPSTTGEKPPVRGDKESIANIQFELLYKHPYQYTSDDVLFKVYAIRNNLTKTEMKEARAIFFLKDRLAFGFSFNQKIWLGCSCRCQWKNCHIWLRNESL
jgi:hypothetical protein